MHAIAGHANSGFDTDALYEADGQNGSRCEPGEQNEMFGVPKPRCANESASRSCAVSISRRDWADVRQMPGGD
jgi:hypothetical protein